MKVGFLQFQPIFGQVENNLEKILKMIEKASDFDLLVLPELANSGYVFSKKEELEKTSEVLPTGLFTGKLAEIAQSRNVAIVCGICEKSGDNFFNSSILLGPTGFVGKYQKIHLFDREKLFFKPGNGPLKSFEVKGVKIGMLICFDWIFPEATRILALEGIDILAHSANLVLPYSQTAMLARSIENRIFTITSNRIGTEKNKGVELTFTGQSQITSPKMEILASAGTDTEEIKIVEIDIELARNKWLNERNHVLMDRRSEFYSKLIE
ncbi:MAG: acyltransferase [Candidatus Heimdallarchaeota archaeon]|nr:acyltransferase [Candidatus Heimdallarchaeota archaeon]